MSILNARKIKIPKPIVLISSLVVIVLKTLEMKLSNTNSRIKKIKVDRQNLMIEFFSGESFFISVNIW